MAGRMSVAEKLEIWRLLRAGTSFRVIGRRLGRSDATIQQYVGLTGGVQPRERTRAANQLSLCEREEISRGMAAGESMRAVARRLGRSPSTVSRELVRNGGRPLLPGRGCRSGGVGPGPPAEALQARDQRAAAGGGGGQTG